MTMPHPGEFVRDLFDRDGNLVAKEYRTIVAEPVAGQGAHVSTATMRDIEAQALRNLDNAGVRRPSGVAPAYGTPSPAPPSPSYSAGGPLDVPPSTSDVPTPPAAIQGATVEERAIGILDSLGRLLPEFPHHTRLCELLEAKRYSLRDTSSQRETYVVAYALVAKVWLNSRPGERRMNSNQTIKSIIAIATALDFDVTGTEVWADVRTAESLGLVLAPSFLERSPFELPHQILSYLADSETHLWPGRPVVQSIMGIPRTGGGNQVISD